MSWECKSNFLPLRASTLMNLSDLLVFDTTREFPGALNFLSAECTIARCGSTRDTLAIS
jgi:hypothetical protein